MKLFGIAFGYEEPFWYVGRWELLLHDRGWTVARDRIIKADGRWPTCNTFRRRARHPFPHDEAPR